MQFNFVQSSFCAYEIEMIDTLTFVLHIGCVCVVESKEQIAQLNDKMKLVGHLCAHQLNL